MIPQWLSENFLTFLSEALEDDLGRKWDAGLESSGGCSDVAAAILGRSKGCTG